MCKMRLVYGLVLALTVLVLAVRHVVESACQDWSLDRDPKNVCCKKCKPGHRLVTDCGLDQHALCTPCGNNTYISDTSQKSCLRCTQCIGIQRVKVRCSPSSDTICECFHGFRCGDGRCSFCVKECMEGQQPVNRTCEPCPPGKYNDKIHHPCIPWSKCTKPDYQITVPGTSKSDIVCDPKREPARTTSPPDNRPKVLPHDNTDNKVTAILVTFGILCIFIPMITILYLEVRTRLKTKRPKTSCCKGCCNCRTD